jgi:16S rRNA (guanine1516-N2)-methyltransferase
VSGAEGVPAGFALARVGAEGDPASFLELRREGEPERRGVRCDLAAIRLRGGASEARGMPVVRAMGTARRVVDATAGLLGDAFLLAAAGLEVTAIERHRAVYLLALDGLARAGRDARLSELIGARIQLVHADAREWLAERSGTAEAPDAVLIDPMFPPKRRASALPRKEMVALRAVVGADDDAAELLAQARLAARERVVVKRGDDAPALGVPDWSIAGTTVRFDVWRGISMIDRQIAKRDA